MERSISRIGKHTLPYNSLVNRDARTVLRMGRVARTGY